MELTEQDLPHLAMRACLEVHRALGRGLTESAYREALARELRAREIEFRRDQSYSVDFHGAPIQKAVTTDFVIEENLALDVCCEEELSESERQRMRATLGLSELKYGLVVNFNAHDMRAGISRILVKEESGDPVPRGSQRL